ncbi:hypothetical protein Cadr_000029983 [Camelus dromedarius]|uniref:Uncharacterized protein n=1 Tax=Camelus dromedarius TaxID=9838 RepID=A0A5N4CCW7_CAMDR|nr:hypothetical protein Cadr_000029983 [Camelus dromedarius]
MVTAQSFGDTCEHTQRLDKAAAAAAEIISNKILVLGKQLELDVDEEDIHKLLGMETEGLPNKELIELEEEKVEAEAISEAQRKFTAKKLAKAFATVTSGLPMLEEMAVNYQRLARPGRYVMLLLAIEKQIIKTIPSRLAVSPRNTTPAKPSSVSVPVPSTSYSQASSEERD